MDVVNIEAYPLLKHYGSMCQRLSKVQAAASTFDERFASIGRFVVGQAIRFYTSTLSPEGRTAYDPEDIFLECWSELKSRNDRYDPARGSYLVFAHRVIANRLSEIIETVHCVQLPANAAEKFRELMALEADGKLDARRSRRLAALIAASVDHEQISLGAAVVDPSDSPEDAVLSSERRKLIEGSVRRLLSLLSARESMALSFEFGLWGRKCERMDFLDYILMVPSGTMGRALSRAKKKLRAECSTICSRTDFF